MKRVISLLFVLIFAFTMAVPALAVTPDTKVVASVNNNTGHDYNAYQIFDGTQSTSDSSLGTIDWGSNVNHTDSSFYPDIQSITLENGTKPFAKCTTAQTVADVLSGKATNCEEAILFSKVIRKYLTGNPTPISKEATSVQVDPGYYLLVDVENFAENATGTVRGLSLLQITGHEFTIISKTGRPTVDKKVQDEAADKDTKSHDTEGWGETADHAIGESFRFELLADIPAATNLDLYTQYMISFQDTMSAGITFEEIESVSINGSPITDYTITAVTVNENGTQSWSLTIPDIFKHNINKKNAVVIKVIYRAHLNEKAAVGNTDDNKNTVYLEYSNNPNGDGTGKTTSDTVWVFTYKIDSTKYKNGITDENVLPGAGFTLYTAEEYSKYVQDPATAQPLKLTYVENSKFYYPNTDSTTTEMFSAENGQFNVYGLDAGIYYLVETTVPAGFNKCEDVKVEIQAGHFEDSSGNTAITEITMFQGTNSASDLRIDIVNQSGATLPETGGMGTTIFYIVGAVLVLAAVVMLITRKRMAADE